MSQLSFVDQGRPAPDGVGHLSWATSNEEMFARILDLYGRPGFTVADVTFGKGRFWKLVEATAYDLLATDLSDGIDCRALPYADESVDMVVFDPPYRYMENKSQPGEKLKLLTGDEYRLGTLERTGVDGVLDLYCVGIQEAARAVRHGGFVVVKCQDTSGDGRQTWVHDHVFGYCSDAGLTVIDFACVVNGNPPPTRWKVQKTLRKAHSYFVVARKGGFHPFGYRSVQAR